MTLSIIIPTYGRVNELLTLLETIYKSNLSHDEFEVIIVDQNSGDTINSLLNYFVTKENLKHINVNFKGLSRAKNYGIAIATGKFVCFPDDDCEFFPNTISNAINLLSNIDLDIVFGKCIDRKGKDSVIKFRKDSQFLDLNSVKGGFVEATLFAKKSVFDKFKFDETMGAGCFHGAEEGYDWLYRVLLYKQFKVFYDPSILFYHPQVIVKKGDDASVRRVFTYRCGFARLCIKHKFYFKYFKRILFVFISLPFFLIVNKRYFRYYFSELLGLIAGIIIK